MRGILNTLGIGVIGGALAVACYTAIALAMHRWNSGWTRLVDYLVLVPRAMPGLLAGLAFLWVFLFLPSSRRCKSTMVSIWLAYTVVWLAYGMRLVSASLLQVGPELEEAARTAGASARRVTRDVTLPLIRYGMLASWLLVFMIFEREYSTGVYLLGPGTEVIGALLVSLWGTAARSTWWRRCRSSIVVHDRRRPRRRASGCGVAPAWLTSSSRTSHFALRRQPDPQGRLDDAAGAARSWRCSGRRAAARRRCCAPSPGWRRRTAARSPSATTCSSTPRAASNCRPRSATSASCSSRTRCGRTGPCSTTSPMA